MSVSYSSNKVTIGNYKSGTTGTSGSSTVVSSGSEFTSSDVGRFISIVYDSINSGLTQIRQIVSYQNSSQVTVHDSWIGLPISGLTWNMSHNLQDVHDIGNSALQKTGDRSYRWDADWNITGFLADVDCSLEMFSRTQPGWKLSDAAIVQFGVLWGGEANNASETTNGCHLVFKTQVSSQSLYVGSGNSGDNGCIVNYYGCLIDSRTSGTWMFQRMVGATRFIGVNFDGVMGGRFRNRYSEWVECRHSGNNNATPAWSIGAEFNRAITAVKFYKNLVCLKSYSNFAGTFKSCTFSESNTDFFLIAGNSAAVVINFVDCTTFGASKVIDSGNNTLRQIKSVSYTLLDSSSTAIEFGKVAIEDKNLVLQDGVQESSITGQVPIINTTFRQMISNTTEIDYTPFVIRIRKYGKKFQQFISSLSSPTKQDVLLQENINLPLLEAAAGAIVGVNINPVAKTITISAVLSSSDIYAYSQWWLFQTTNMQVDQALTTVDGVNFLLDSSWTLILQNEISDGINLTGNVIVSNVFDFSSHNIAGQLTFETTGTYNIIDSIITEVINNSGDLIILNISGSTTITTNTGPNVTIQSSILLSFIIKDQNGVPIENASVYIDENNSTPILFSSNTNAQGKATFAYTGNSLIGTTWRVRKYGYKYSKSIVDIGITDILLPITLITDPQQV